MTRSRWLLLAFRVIVGGVFIWAGLLKIASPLDFAQSVQNYRFFPRDLGFLIALVLPWAEVLSGAFLIASIFKRSAALVLALFLGGFIVLVGLALLRGIDTACGCFGSFSRRADLTLILADAVLLYFTLSVFFAGSAANTRSSADLPGGKRGRI